MKEFKTTGSTAHNIMGNAKKKGELSAGAKTYLKEWVVATVFNRKKEIDSKYLKKGLVNEDMNLKSIAKHFGWDKLENNKTRKENEYYSGEYDAMKDDLLIDLKSSWDVFTFGKKLFIENTQESVKKNFPNYYWQAQVYMDLWDKKDYQLIFVLSDTPDDIIEKEFRFNNKDNLEWNEFIKKHKFDDILDKDKIIVFDIERDDDDIEEIKTKVLKAREYIKEIWKEK